MKTTDAAEKTIDRFVSPDHPQAPELAADEHEVPLRQISRPPCTRCFSIHTRRCRRSMMERVMLSLSDNRPWRCESCGKRFYSPRQAHDHADH
ncbi:MAG: hypothetical protein ACKV2V_02030 [Blastocatellia bacterium]